MKIIILGATGKTGTQLVEQACNRGHEVTALVRNPSKIEHIKHDKLKIIKCNLLDSNDMAKNFQGHDCVFSSLGNMGLCSSESFPQQSMLQIITAMHSAKLKRIILVSSQYTKPNLPSYPLAYKIFLRCFLGKQFRALYIMEEYLFNECSDIDFTIVRPPMLKNQPLSSAKEIAAEDKYHVDNMETKVEIPRANVAKFMLDILDSNQFLKKGVSIDMPKK